MKEFFKSQKFHALVVVGALLTAFFLKGLYEQQLMPFFSTVGGFISAPFSTFSASLVQATNDAVSPYVNASELAAENARLKTENQQLIQQMIDYENLQIENYQFREFLEIKERNKDFVFEPATVIGRSPDSLFGSFIIDVGTQNGVNLRDPVITPEGLIGIVTSVSYSYAKVSTILDPTVDIGVVSSRTLDTGIVSGTIDLFEQNLTRLGYLTRDSGVSAGDIITTSGVSGLLPRGLVIGIVEGVESDTSGLSMFATIRPSADIYNTKSVTVIKDFSTKDTDPVT